MLEKFFTSHVWESTRPRVDLHFNHYQPQQLKQLSQCLQPAFLIPMRAPPRWASNWRRLMVPVLTFLRQAVGLGYRLPWMTKPEELDMRDCKHKKTKRYGNIRSICKVPSVQRSVLMEPVNRNRGLHGFVAILTIAMLREHTRGGALPSQAAASSTNSSGMGASAKARPKARASTTTFLAFTREEREELMTQVLARVRKEMAGQNTPQEDLQMMEADMIQNFDDYYLQQHQQDLEGLLQTKMTAHQIFNNELDGAEWIEDSDHEDLQVVP